MNDWAALLVIYSERTSEDVGGISLSSVIYSERA